MGRIRKGFSNCFLLLVCDKLLCATLVMQNSHKVGLTTCFFLHLLLHQSTAKQLECNEESVLFI